jgi:hypothetical protein
VFSGKWRHEKFVLRKEVNVMEMLEVGMWRKRLKREVKVIAGGLRGD